MQVQHAKLTFAGVWILTQCLIGLAAGIGDLSGWILLVGAALLPPLVMLRMWNPPAKTLSETIDEARR